ncbi:MAG: aminoglycoside phosphotransferase, partial [Pseudomonadota bacterium]
MTSRPAETQAFLADAGWADAIRTPLAADASVRRYARLRGPRGTAILMDAGPDADFASFLDIAARLAA